MNFESIIQKLEEIDEGYPIFISKVFIPENRDRLTIKDIPMYDRSTDISIVRFERERTFEEGLTKIPQRMYAKRICSIYARDLRRYGDRVITLTAAIDENENHSENHPENIHRRYYSFLYSIGEIKTDPEEIIDYIPQKYLNTEFRNYVNAVYENV